MDQNTFVEQVAGQLSDMGIPYHFDANGDISISTSFQNQEAERDGSDSITYTALIALRQEQQAVYADEHVVMGTTDVSQFPGYEKLLIKTNDSGPVMTIAAILGSVETIAASYGLSLIRTGSPSVTAGNSAVQSQSGLPVKRKVPAAAIALIAILVVGGLAAGGIFLGTRNKNDQTEPTPAATTEASDQEGSPTTTQPPAAESSETMPATVPEETDTTQTSAPETTVTEPAPTAASVDSAVVSSGVQTSDLGNIMNGQYYFAADELVFYSSFDENNLAHIYSVNKDGTDLKAIFDGFGWSLVVIDDWLYFSGNQGPAIDGTYTIFRMKLDGSQLEKVNDTYSYGMFYYGSSLYYMKQSEDYQDLMGVCRANLDGTNEEVLSSNGFSPLVYKDQLYYFDNQGNMFRTKPDGSEPEVLLTASVKSYAISNEKIIYSDFDNNISICDLDGSNQLIISRSGDIPIFNVNAYGDRVFYSEYDPEFNYTSYGYNYTIKSCGLDGSDQKTVFSSVSYGIYMNLVDNKLMMLDYTLANTSGAMTAEIKVMDLDGSNASTLAR